MTIRRDIEFIFTANVSLSKTSKLYLCMAILFFWYVSNDIYCFFPDFIHLPPVKKKKPNSNLLMYRFTLPEYYC